MHSEPTVLFIITAMRNKLHFVIGEAVMVKLFFSNPLCTCPARVTVPGLQVYVCQLPRFLGPRATGLPKSETKLFSSTLA